MVIFTQSLYKWIMATSTWMHCMKNYTYLHGCICCMMTTAIPLDSLSVKLMAPNTNAPLSWWQQKMNWIHGCSRYFVTYSWILRMELNTTVDSINLDPQFLFIIRKNKYTEKNSWKKSFYTSPYLTRFYCTSWKSIYLYPILYNFDDFLPAIEW